MTFAVVPAAGQSTRMGRPKLALPLAERAVIEHVVAALREGGVRDVLVVVGPHVRELAPLAESAGAHVLRLDEATPDMRATVERGLLWLEERFAPGAADAWFLVPGDHPTLDAGVVRRLSAARAERPECTIVVPTYGGRRGHPALIGWSQVAGLRAAPLGQGLNVYLRSQAPVTWELPVAAPSVLCDLDTPEDYERLLLSFATSPSSRRR